MREQSNTDKYTPASIDDLWPEREAKALEELEDAEEYSRVRIKTTRLKNFFRSLRPHIRKSDPSRLKELEAQASAIGLFIRREISVRKYSNLLDELMSYTSEIDAHKLDLVKTRKQDQTSKVPKRWLNQVGIDVKLSPIPWFEKGLATIITGENGSGKTTLMAWCILQLLKQDNPHGLRPVVATNVKFYPKWVKKHGIKIVRNISEIFDVVAWIDLMGERRNLYVFIDEFDGAEGQNAWETRGKEAAAAFKVFNQMRKTQEIILVPSIHYPQDINSRWRVSLQGVHSVLNKGKSYPKDKENKVWDCVKIKNKKKMLKSVGIWWGGKGHNLDILPDMSDYFETYAGTSFSFDYTPYDVSNLMERIDRIPLSEHGTEEEREEWLTNRGKVIQEFNKEWREKPKKKVGRLKKAKLKYIQEKINDGLTFKHIQPLFNNQFEMDIGVEGVRKFFRENEYILEG